MSSSGVTFAVTVVRIIFVKFLYKEGQRLRKIDRWVSSHNSDYSSKRSVISFYNLWHIFLTRVNTTDFRPKTSHSDEFYSDK